MRKRCRADACRHASRPRAGWPRCGLRAADPRGHAGIGHSANGFGPSGTAHDFIGRVYRLGGAVLFLLLVARAVVPGIDGLVGAIPSLVRPAVAWSGLAVMVVGGGLILAAQVTMGTSWRIGLDRERTGLVTMGLFA